MRLASLHVRARFLAAAVALGALLLGIGPAAHAGVCARQCAVGQRQCRRDAQRQLRRQQRSCRALFDRETGACRPGADCRRYGDVDVCRTEEAHFAAERLARCDRIGAACETCCAAAGGRGSCRGATLVVDGPDFLGAVGDDTLSLTEAILLATGRLEPGALGVQERRQVRGRPGAGRADRIRFARGLSVAIRRQDAPVDTILPPLTDAGDQVAGDVVLDGTPMNGTPQSGAHEIILATDEGLVRIAIAPLLVIMASDVEVAGLHFDRVVTVDIVVVGSSAPGVEHVIIRDNTFAGLGREVLGGGISIVAGGNGYGNRLADVWVKDNRVVDVQNPISFFAASATENASASGSTAERIHVVGNTVERGNAGIIAGAATAPAGGVVEDNVLRDVEVARNRVVENLDVGIGMSTSVLLAGAVGRRNVVERVSLRDNDFFTPPGFGRLNSGFFLSGAQLVLGAGGASDADHLDDLAVERNVLDGVATGALVFAGYVERCGDGCRVTGGLVEHVTFRGNTWRNVDNGLVVAASGAGEAAGIVDGSVLRDLEVAEEDMAARTVGIVLQGGMLFPVDLCAPVFAGCTEFPGYRLPGALTASALGPVTVRASTLGGQDPVVIFGGMSNVTEDTASGMMVHDVTLADNVITPARSGVNVIGGLVLTSGTVTGSQVRDVRLTGNRTASGEPVPVIPVDELASGAPPGSVQGNTVTGVTVE